MPRLSTIAGAVLAAIGSVSGVPAARPQTHPEVRVLLFVTSDCPLSNGYAPEISRLCDRHGADGVSCTLVYEDVHIEDAAVRAHQGAYGLSAIPFVIDRDRRVARAAGATVTPQAVVVDRMGAVRYRGRIDNRYAAFGKPRQVITQHDLSAALDAVVAGRPVAVPHTEALGCFIVPPTLAR